MKKSQSLLMTMGLVFGLLLEMSQSSLSSQNGGDDEMIVALGTVIFFDANLSVDGKQSCASCHDPSAGFTGPDSEMNAHGAVEPGTVPGRFGNRKPPTAAYGGESPLLYYDEGDDGGTGSWIGGMGGGEMGGGGMGGGMGGMGPNLDLFPPPEYDENRIVMQQFNFMMDGPKIMAFLRTLSDGYFERQ